MGSTRIGPRSAGAILLAALTFLMTGLLWSPARALNTFMVMKLSLVVEHDSKDLAVHNKVDLSLYNPSNKLIKTFSEIEYIETQYSAETEGYHLYCYSNKHNALRAPVSFSIMTPEDEVVDSKKIEDILKIEDGKDYKPGALSDLMRLENTMRYLVLRVEFLERRTAAHNTKLKRIRRATMYWKAVQLLAAVAFAVFQVFCTKRYV